ncbi:hypothetical protein FXN61_36160 [Lentzea sp. PSKA42]|uniref:Uncharacterized protein n=1 Tax=Lentzea indica TaxID=2604800 RepID=A0ABX1FSK9_9PSEU|nr:hypothetical protein [Lentzea indica]NKE61905.1 hypothetical protein [Lentzea indica]
MIKTLLSATVAGLVAFSGASTASAAEGETAPIDIRMTLHESSMIHEYPGEDGPLWSGRGMFDFSVLLTDVGEGNEQGVTVFLSVPDTLDVRSWGDGWSCEDTEGGIDCYHPDLVVPGEAWPELHFRGFPSNHVQDTIDVYATTGDYAPAHEGVHYFNDTST